jgi:hypothetical protein
MTQIKEVWHLQYLHIMKTTITMTEVIHVSMTWTMLMQILLPLFLYLKLLHYTDSPPTYSELTHTLTKRFSPPHQFEMHMAQVDARIRKRRESLPELAQDVKRLIRLAHPFATAEIHDKLSHRAFRNALNDHDREWAIVTSTIESIDEALVLALKYEVYNMSTRKPSIRYQSLYDTVQANNT